MANLNREIVYCDNYGYNKICVSLTKSERTVFTDPDARTFRNWKEEVKYSPSLKNVYNPSEYYQSISW